MVTEGFYDGFESIANSIVFSLLKFCTNLLKPICPLIPPTLIYSIVIHLIANVFQIYFNVEILRNYKFLEFIKFSNSLG